MCINLDFERLLAHKLCWEKSDNQSENVTIPETGPNENNYTTENESEEEAQSNDEVAEANKSPTHQRRDVERVIMINLMHHKHTQILLLTNWTSTCIHRQH